MICIGDGAQTRERNGRPKIPAALGKRFVSCASTEQRCTQEIASVPNDSNLLTSVTMKPYVCYKQGDFMLFARRRY